MGTVGLLLGSVPAAAGAAPDAPVVKPTVSGLYDRQHVANPAYLPVVNGEVVKVDWSSLQPAPGGPITANNLIDKAVAEAQRLNAEDASRKVRLKLRVYAGVNAPDWAKQLDGPPITLIDPQSSVLIGTVGRFWTPRFKAAYDELQAKLAAKYDASDLIVDTNISRCTTQYNEPFLRQAALAANRVEYLAAGYSVEADQRCQSEQIDTHARTWVRTRSSLAFNPYQRISATGMNVDEPYTESMMTYCRQRLGSRCVLANNSLQWPLDGGEYTSMYAALTSLGAPLSFQTATAAKIGDWAATLDWAAAHGANMVELNADYDPSYPVDQLAGYDARLEANRTS